jgi:hypothetical protein
MKRPVGLILTSILLALEAGFLLLLAALMTFTGIATSRSPAIATSPVTGAKFVLIFSLGIATGFALFAVWAICTLIGLLRLRNWARISMLILGGGQTFVGLIAAVGMLAMIFIPLPIPPNQAPHLQAIAFSVLGLFYAVVAAVGIWWLVYFSRTAIRDLFLNPSHDIAGLPPTPFQTGQTFSKPGRFAHVPASIMIIGSLYLLSACICALLALLPFPAFMMGVIFTSFGAHILYLSIAIVAGAIGYGLLRLANWARIATLVMLGIGFLNAGLALLPWYEARFRLYNRQVTDSMHLPAPAVFMPDLTHFYTIFGVLTIVLFNGAIFWFLQRHKRAFHATPPPPAVALESY